MASTVTSIPAADAGKYAFSSDSDILESSDTRRLAPGTVVQIGDELVKIESVESAGALTRYRWTAPSLDEAFDEIDIRIPSIEVTTEVLATDTTGQARSADLSQLVSPASGKCGWDVVRVDGESGLEVECNVPAAASTSIRMAGRLTAAWKDVVIRKPHGGKTTQSYQVKVSFTPEVGLKIAAGDKPIQAAFKDAAGSLYPPCVAAAIKGQRPLSFVRNGASIRTYTGTIPMGRVGWASVNAPTCVVLDASDSRIGFEAVGQATWSFTLAAAAGSLPHLVDYQFEAPKLLKAIGDSALLPGLTFGATGIFRVIPEIVPTFNLGLGKFTARGFGFVISPSFNVEARLWSSLTKANTCADGYLRTKIQFFVPGEVFDVDTAGLVGELPLFKNLVLSGDECEPPLRPVYTGFSLPYRAIRPFEPTCPYEYAYDMAADFATTYTVAAAGCGIYQQVTSGIEKGYGYTYNGPGYAAFNNAQQNSTVVVQAGDIASTGPLRRVDALSRFEGQQCEMSVSPPGAAPDFQPYIVRFAGTGVQLAPPDPDDPIVQIDLPLADSTYSERYTPSKAGGKKLELTLAQSSGWSVQLVASDRSAIAPGSVPTWSLWAYQQSANRVLNCIGTSAIRLPGMD